MDYFKRFKKLFMRFWKSENSTVSLVRDVFIAFIIVFIIILALWTYTGHWFGTPMVAIESSSMMHRNEPFGRIGTIDAGDMVLLVKVDNRGDIDTYAEENGKYNYGKQGDVIIYQPDGQTNRDRIIHRAMCWIEVKDVNNKKTYTIEELGIYEQDADIELYYPDLGIMSLDGEPIKVNWANSGFITKGDNPDTNQNCDQIGGITSQPVKVEWISGKASGELPWIGTINLFFNDLTSGKNTVGNVYRDARDSIDCLVILIEALILIPVGLDINSYYKERKKKSNQKNDNDAEITILYYWLATIFFIPIFIFLIGTDIGMILQLILITIVYYGLMFLVNIEDGLRNIKYTQLLIKIKLIILLVSISISIILLIGSEIILKDLQLWLILVLFIGPIGLTILYFNQNNFNLNRT